MSALPSPASGAVPRGWEIDHETPTDYVVRCTHCGRISIEDNRGSAHRTADDHGLRCHATGVTPVSRPTETAVEPDTPDAPPTAALLDVEPDPGLVGQELAIRYESVSRRASTQQAAGTVSTISPAPADADSDYEAIILRLPSEAQRRIDLQEGRVECPHNAAPGWRKIGDLERLSSATRLDDQAIAADGGTPSQP